MKQILSRILIVVFSVGWIVPLWISVYFYLSFVGGELRPYIVDGEFPRNSAPYIAISMEAFTISCAWLASVMIFWVWTTTSKK